MNLDFDSIGSIVGVVIGIAAIVDRAFGPQNTRIKALEETQRASERRLEEAHRALERLLEQELSVQKLSVQRLAIQGEGLEKVLGKLSDAIEKLEARIVDGRGAHR
jgi:hypothetical protein